MSEFNRRTVAAVVVTRNRLELLKRCIDALREQSYKCDIFVVDNDSKDNTFNWLSNQCDIKYVNTGSNLGGAGGFNIGVKWAVESGYDYIWLMDDDTIPRSNSLEELMKASIYLKEDYGWLSSVALWTDGSKCKMNIQKTCKNAIRNNSLIQHGIVQSVQSTFVSLLVQSKVICKVGLPIKEFFIWGDDIEFTRRIAVREKIHSYVVENSCVIHAMNNNSGSNIAIDNSDRLNRYYYAFRNENYLYRKEGVKGFAFYFAKCGYNLIKILLLSKNKRIKRCWIIFRQFFVGLFFNPKVETI